MKPILFVDDDVRVVSAIQRSLYRTYRIEIAGNAGDALELVNHAPYAAVVSDLKMPGMDGIEFLGEVKRRSPETVRVLLTGQADTEAAIAAVNEGSVFRFLTKPCALELLKKTLDAALEQYRLQSSERDVLRETLMGTVAVLVEILAVIRPVAFSHGARARWHMRTLARQLGLEDVWEFEAAAMLSQIGCITVDPAVLERYYEGKELSKEETDQLLHHPHAAWDFLRRIPRLHTVAQIVERQMDDFAVTPALAEEKRSVALGAQMLRVALDFQALAYLGIPLQEAIAKLRRAESKYNPEVLAAFENSVHENQSYTKLEPGGHGPNANEKLFRPITDEVLRALRPNYAVDHDRGEEP